MLKHTLNFKHTSNTINFNGTTHGLKIRDTLNYLAGSKRLAKLHTTLKYSWRCSYSEITTFETMSPERFHSSSFVFLLPVLLHHHQLIIYNMLAPRGPNQDQGLIVLGTIQTQSWRLFLV